MSYLSDDENCFKKFVEFMYKYEKFNNQEEEQKMYFAKILWLEITGEYFRAGWEQCKNDLADSVLNRVAQCHKDLEK